MNDPIIGWRCWRFNPATCLLYSVVRQTSWPRFVRLEASEQPTYDGFLGIHAWSERRHLDRFIKLESTTIPVWGEVSLWGHVVEHEEGYRAQFAYPFSLLLLPSDHHHAAALSGAYGVEALSL